MACAPVSESECAAIAVGLQLGGAGHAFAGDYTIKGCYAYRGTTTVYAGMVFYGRGGDEAERFRLAVDPPVYRPAPHCEGLPANLVKKVSVELAPFAREQLARSPGDLTVGTVRHSNFASEEGVFFKPIPNRPWSGTSEAGSDRLLGLKAAIPVTFTVPESGEYMIGLEMRKGCDQFRQPGSTFDAEQVPKCLYPCDQCQRSSLSCSSTDSFFLCTSDPRSEPSNPATSLALETCDKYHTNMEYDEEKDIHFMGQALPRGRVHNFSAGEDITVYLTAREACTVANRLLVFGRPNVTDAGPDDSIRMVDYTYPHFLMARTCVKSYPTDLAAASACAFGILGTMALWLHLRWRGQRRRESGALAQERITGTPLMTTTSTSDVAEINIHLNSVRSFEAARRLRIRVSGASLALGWILTCYGLAPFIRGVQIKTYYENNALGPFPFWLILVAPGTMLMLLAVLPTDRSAIRVLNVAMLVLNLAIAAGAAAGLVIANRQMGLILAGKTKWGTSVWAEWNAQAEAETVAAEACVICVSFLNLRYFAVPYCSRPATPRATLMRLWAYVRFTYVYIGAILILKAAVPLIYRPIEVLRMQDIFCGSYGLWAISFFLAGVSFIAFAALASPKNRGWARQWLAKLAKGGTRLQQAMVIASLLGDIGPSEALARARLHFRTIEFDKLPPDCFNGAGLLHGEVPVGLPHGEVPRDEKETRSNETVEEAGIEGPADSHTSWPSPELCAIGECDAFVSHAWIDEHMHRGMKYATLEKWASAATEPPKLWLDRICLSVSNLEQTLPLLPVFIIGSKSLVMITGPAYSTRLWTILELFVFFQCNQQDTERAIVLPIGDVDVASMLSSFDARRASCAVQEDRDTLLGLIEANFGDLRMFNKMVRGLKLQA